MSDTTFSAGTVIPSSWLNDINDAIYDGKDFSGIVPINIKSPVYGATGDGTTDDTAAIQAALNSGSKHIYIPKGDYKITSALSVGNGITISGDGILSRIFAYGVNGISITAESVVIENLSLFSYSAGAVADPKTFVGITLVGTSTSDKRNFPIIRSIYFQGWNYCIDYKYTDFSLTHRIYTINSNHSIRYYGQSVNNIVSDSFLICNTGISSIITEKNGADQGEGLLVSNCLLSSGQHAFRSDGWLSVGFYNCIADLLSDYAFKLNGVVNFVFDGPWVYSAKRCFSIENSGASLSTDSRISCGLATTTGATESCIVIATNNNNVVIESGVYSVTSATGGYPIFSQGTNVSIGQVIIKNTSSNPDIYADGTNLKVSSSALLTNAIEWVTSPLRSINSAATTTLPIANTSMYEVITVNGNTNCTQLNDPASWIGKTVVLRFTGTPTWTDGGNLKLSANFVATADDTLTLTSDGTSWYEVARSTN